MLVIPHGQPSFLNLLVANIQQVGEQYTGLILRRLFRFRAWTIGVSPFSWVLIPAGGLLLPLFITEKADEAFRSCG